MNHALNDPEGSPPRDAGSATGRPLVPGPEGQSPLADIIDLLSVIYVTGLIVALGASLGGNLLRPAPRNGVVLDPGLRPFTNWDGQFYTEIARRGYFYDPARYSSVVFFPAYPLAGRLVSALTGLPHQYALLFVSNACLVAAVIIFYYYIKIRRISSPASLPRYTALAVCLVPTSFFFRVAYSESFFLLVCIVAFYAMERGWRPEVTAVVIGLATAARPVGLALICPFLLHLWSADPRWGSFLKRAPLLASLACWGLFGYMAYLYRDFHDPLVFAKGQARWREFPEPPLPPSPLPQKLLALATFEPVWRLFNPDTRSYWRDYDPDLPPVFSLHVADHVMFVASIALLAIGAAKRWLSAEEVVFTLMMLLIPYYLTGYETNMRSMARYCSSVFTIYLVAGHLLCRARLALSSSLLGLCGFLLGVYTALFAAWYNFM